MEKLILLEIDGTVHMRDALDGNQISFDNLAEFERITGETLPDTKYYLYEPPLFHVVGFRGKNTPGMDNTQAERLISQIPAYLIYQNDPLYGLSGQELADKQAELEAQAEFKARYDAIMQEREAAGVRNLTPEQVKTYIDNQVAAADTAGEKFQVLVSLIKKLAVFVLQPDPPTTNE